MPVPQQWRRPHQVCLGIRELKAAALPDGNAHPAREGLQVGKARVVVFKWENHGMVLLEERVKVRLLTQIWAALRGVVITPLQFLGDGVNQLPFIPIMLPPHLVIKQ